MEDWESLVSRWSSLGPLVPQARFIIPNIASDFYQSMKLPDAFHEDFSHSFPKYLGIKCKTNLWRVNYDAHSRRIHGISKLMMFLHIKPFDVLNLNYYGEGLFKLRVFRRTGDECSYAMFGKKKLFVEDSFDFENGLSPKNSVEFERNLTLLWFNAVGRVTSIFEKKISNQSVHTDNAMLVLDKEMEPYYRHWKKGEKVSLKLSQLQWEIEVVWSGNACHLGKGWLEFVRDTNLRKGNYLIIGKPNPVEEYTLPVCIFKKAEVHSKEEDKFGQLWLTFFKIVQEPDLKLGDVVVPKNVLEKYGSILCLVNDLKVCSDSWKIDYDAEFGVIKNLHEMLHTFGVKSFETLVFTIRSSFVVTLRIYRADGVEIDYDDRKRGIDNGSSCESMWNLVFSGFEGQKYGNADEDIEMDEFKHEEGNENELIAGALSYDINKKPEEEKAGNEVILIEISDSESTDEYNEEDLYNDNDEVMADEDMEFTKQLSKCHVDKKTHGVFIPENIKPRNRDWRKTDLITMRTNKGVWTLGLILQNGKARFSAGWNKFVSENEYAVSNVLKFNMFESEDGISFQVTNI